MKDLVLARETRACVILFRIHSGNYHIIIFICRLFNELQKHEWRILFLWMFVFLLPHALQELRTLKARCFVRLNIFSFRFFPFLIIFKTGFSGYWNLIARFNIFQNWILKPNISGPQDPCISQPTNPPTPNQIEQETGDEENQLAVTAKFCIDSDPTSMRFIVWRARYGLDYARFIISNLLIN